MGAKHSIRLSLAGAQDKIAVRLDDGKISRLRGSAPSSDVLKSAMDTYEAVVFNEPFCMALARECDLNLVPVEIAKGEDIDCLLAQRFDRIRREDGNIQRHHQNIFFRRSVFAHI